MTNTSPFCTRPGNPTCAKRSGITLIEVIASTVLISTLLVGILVSFGRHQRQLNQVADKQRAIVAMNQLMMDWFRGNEQSFPVEQSGTCSNDPKLFWTSRATGRFRFAGKLDAVSIQVDIYSTQEPDHSLLSLEIVDRFQPTDPNGGDL